MHDLRDECYKDDAMHGFTMRDECERDDAVIGRLLRDEAGDFSGTMDAAAMRDDVGGVDAMNAMQ
jgi:hypothetical protein